MSRSNPTENTPNPCTRWFEWDGSNGIVRYYDKTEKKNIEVGDDITFILLDQLATIKGWNDASDSGIYSNEVKDTRAEPFIVKAFKAKQPIAEGIYKQIRDRVAAAGGQFVTNCYIAYREDKKLHLGSIQFKGAALNAWVEFSKPNRKSIYEQAVQIKGSTSGKKGKIVFKTPNFELKDITEATNAEATEIDKTLQAFLADYFKRTRVEQSDQPHNHDEDDSQEPPPEERGGHNQDYSNEDESIPF